MHKSDIFIAQKSSHLNGRLPKSDVLDVKRSGRLPKSDVLCKKNGQKWSFLIKISHGSDQ
jgi:hypothetical protein